MNLDQAARYWSQRLNEGKPIYRVRVRRLLELAGAERRGWAIMRRISETLESNGLKTVPDFQSAWIDALVTIRLMDGDATSEDRECGELQQNRGEQDAESCEIVHDQGGLGPFGGEDTSIDNPAAPVAEDLNSPVGSAGVVEVPVVSPDDAVIRVSSIPAANRGVVSVLLTDPISKATTLQGNHTDEL